MIPYSAVFRPNQSSDHGDVLTLRNSEEVLYGKAPPRRRATFFFFVSGRELRRGGRGRGRGRGRRERGRRVPCRYQRSSYVAEHLFSLYEELSPYQHGVHTYFRISTVKTAQHDHQLSFPLHRFFPFGQKKTPTPLRQATYISLLGIFTTLLPNLPKTLFLLRALVPWFMSLGRVDRFNLPGPLSSPCAPAWLVCSSARCKMREGWRSARLVRVSGFLLWWMEEGGGGGGGGGETKRSYRREKKSERMRRLSARTDDHASQPTYQLTMNEQIKQADNEAET